MPGDSFSGLVDLESVLVCIRNDMNHTVNNGKESCYYVQNAEKNNIVNIASS